MGGWCFLPGCRCIRVIFDSSRLFLSLFFFFFFLAAARWNIRSLRGHRAAPTCLALSPDDSTAYTGAKDCCILKCSLFSALLCSALPCPLSLSLSPCVYFGVGCKGVSALSLSFVAFAHCGWAVRFCALQPAAAASVFVCCLHVCCLLLPFDFSTVSLSSSACCMRRGCGARHADLVCRGAAWHRGHGSQWQCACRGSVSGLWGIPLFFFCLFPLPSLCT